MLMHSEEGLAADSLPDEPASKRARVDDDHEDTAGPEVPPPPLGDPPPPPPGDPPPDALTAALTKIASHIGSPKKFLKASGLLRQLLAGGGIVPLHGQKVFAALQMAMSDPAQADEPDLRKEYQKLFTVASKAKQLFTLPQRSQLDVYGVWAVLRPQLATDDSFVFNRVVGRIKQSVAALPEASGEDDVVQARQQSGGAAQPADNAVTAGGQAGASAAGDSSGLAPATRTEADPFGLDSVIHQQSAMETWSSEDAESMRRAALLDCFDSMCLACVNAWAQVSTETAIEELVKHRTRFAPDQQQRITDLHHFAKDQRMRRRRGPSAADRRRDTTAFEAARKDWAGREVSHRGTIMQGDHKSETWLG